MVKKIIIIMLLCLSILCVGCKENQSSEKSNNSQTVGQSQQNTANTVSTNTSTESEITYKGYTNSRYGYSIEYPSTFVIKINPDNGDGLGYISSDTKTELSVYGSNNINNDTPVSVYNNFLSEHGDLAYKKQESNWYVASWVEGNKIVYQKTVVGSGSEDTFIIKYPISQKEYYDPIVSHLNSSFKTPAVNSSH